MSIGPLGYLLASASFSLLAIAALVLWKKRVAGTRLTPAIAASALCYLVLWGSESGTRLSAWQLTLLECFLDLVWLYVVASILRGATGRHTHVLQNMGLWVVGVTAAVATLALALQGSFIANLAIDDIRSIGLAIASLAGLIAVEQIIRNVRPSGRLSVKYLCYGIALLFSYDFFIYTVAVAQGEINSTFWDARGYVSVFALPMFVVAIMRDSGSNRSLFASRQVVFYSTTIIAAAVYLGLVGLFAAYLQSGSELWGTVAQTVFLVAAALLFLALLFSSVLQGRISVFFKKHFFDAKYDYRREWLRLIDTLTSAEDPLPLRKKAIKAIAQVVGAEEGILWMKSPEADNFECVCGWNIAASDRVIRHDSDLIRFLSERKWVLNLAEFSRDSSVLAQEGQEQTLENLGDEGILVPLVDENEITGLILLPNVKASAQFDYEDFDLLKTAGRQVASYLALEALSEKMNEVRQFEAFNKLTAYLMHDLSNIIAQQSLVVENAARFRDNPKFVDDVIDTVGSGVNRMRKVLELLRQKGRSEQKTVCDLEKVVSAVVAECGDRAPFPTIDCRADSRVLAEPGRLRMIIYHAIRNAQDATGDDGLIRVILDTTPGTATVEIHDSGCGMSAAFVRDRLFRPFDTTKGPRGMGIGAYQIREYLHEMGGDIKVESEVGIGTRLRMKLPQCQRPVEGA